MDSVCSILHMRYRHAQDNMAHTVLCQHCVAAKCNVNTLLIKKTENTQIEEDEYLFLLVNCMHKHLLPIYHQSVLKVTRTHSLSFSPQIRREWGEREDKRQKRDRTSKNQNIPLKLLCAVLKKDHHQPPTG